MKKAEKPTVQISSIEEMLQQKGYFVYTNIGISMLPLIRENRDIIEIHRKGPGRCKKYDVVLYKRNDRFIMHRILEVLPDGYLIAGDNCTSIEKDINDDDILGVMTKMRRNGKTITDDNKLYRLYVHLWCDHYNTRIWLLKRRNSIVRVLVKIKHRIEGYKE